MHEETLLLAKYLRGEIDEWEPRITKSKFLKINLYRLFCNSGIERNEGS